MKSEGPSIEPCGTPFITLMKSDILPSMITALLLLQIIRHTVGGISQYNEELLNTVKRISEAE